MTGQPLFAATLEQLRHAPNLTPQRFARFFSDFEFKEHREVQTAEVFLATQSGDCDDFATLAATILGERGYTVRLISVRMPGQTHVVAYIQEIGGYLDYNNRGYLIKTTACRPEPQAIAARVAESFDLEWTSASEFKWEGSDKRMVSTVIPTGKQQVVPVLLAQATPPKININF